MTDFHQPTLNRKTRRKYGAQAHRERAAQAQNNKVIESDHSSISEGLEEIGAMAAKAVNVFTKKRLGLSEDQDLEKCYVVGPDLFSNIRPRSAEYMYVVFIPIVAAIALRDRGIACRIVAGEAAWTIGTEENDWFEIGMTDRYKTPDAVAGGSFFIWLEIDGHLVDFGARLLQGMLEHAASVSLFSTPRSECRKLPKTIVHCSSQPMPSRSQDRDAFYYYRERSESFQNAVMAKVAMYLPDLRSALQHVRGQQDLWPHRRTV